MNSLLKVDDLLEGLDNKFDDMTGQFIERSEFKFALQLRSDCTMYLISLNAVDQMSGDVDKLEASIQDIINSDVQLPSSMPQSPGTPGFGGPMIKRTASASAS